MCDMQKMPRDDTCEEEDMNFAAFSAVDASGAHFVSSGVQVPVAKMQQTMANNVPSLSQVVGMVGGVTVSEGVQYSSIQSAPQFISVPIALPGAKPGEPQPMMQIQVLNPNMLQAQQPNRQVSNQQPKYQMQIPIQGFPQGGAMLTVAYSPEAADALMGQNSLTENMQILAALPQEMQLVQQQTQTSEDKNEIQANIQHQVFITPDQQIIINGPHDKMNNNTTTNNNNDATIIIKEECDDRANDDESSQGTECSESTPWSVANSQRDLVKYLNSLPPQQTQALPLSLQQFLRINSHPASSELGKSDPIDIDADMEGDDKKEAVAEAIINEDGSVRIQTKKKKKYKKKPPKPARPKPGQVVIATASDGTAIFCCPECQMAYPEKEQLEVHLAVHKIVRRFICGICGAGLKRKEHLERHKLGHNPERPYVCGVCRKGFKRREHLNLHTVIHSGVKTEMCTECGKGFYRKDHLRKHARSHESKRARDETQGAQYKEAAPAGAGAVLPEITIHVPTSSNIQVPVQINIPPHVVSSLAAAQQQQQQQQQQQTDAQAQLEALLAQHS